MSTTLEQAGLKALSVNGSVDIFCVHRSTVGNETSVTGSSGAGKDYIFRQRARWTPKVPQSNRGIAMFLSSLRVFVALAQDMSDEERLQDAILHVFDLLTGFPPALRALHILIADKTPTAGESAALSHAVFEVLDSFMPTDIVGSDQSRIFEGARLLFGFILEKARGLKLPAEEGASLPYLSSFETLELRDHVTNEAVKRIVQTTAGITETDLFDAFQDGGLLHKSHLQNHLVRTEADCTKARQSLLAGGSNPEVVVFSAQLLASNYRYKDSGNSTNAFELGYYSTSRHTELSFAVHKPILKRQAIQRSHCGFGR